MSIKQAVFGECSLTKVAGLFPTRAAAEAAARHLVQIPGVRESQVRLIGPGTDTLGDAFSRRMEPEQNGIWRTLLRAHAFSAAVGVGLGVLLYMALILAGQPAVLASPLLALIAIMLFSALFGLLLGGLLTLRPDHTRVINAVRKGVERGYWAVVTHPMNSKQVALMEDELNRFSQQVVRTL